jgi:hypothetical protein
MVAPSLVGPDMRKSKELLAELEREGLPIVAAFWSIATAEHGWRLVIASPRVDREGALPVYRQVQEALDHLHETSLWVGDIFVVGKNDAVVQMVRRGPAAHLPPDMMLSITLPLPSPSTPYLPDEVTGVTVYPLRIVPESDPEAAAGLVNQP